MVEAFSIRGLGCRWPLELGERIPPFTGDNAFGAAIRQYQKNVIDGYAGKAVDRKSYTDLAGWFREVRRPPWSAEVWG